MTSDEQLAWATGLFEGEGSIAITYSVSRGHRYTVVRLSLSMTDFDVVRRFHQIVKHGATREEDRGVHQTQLRWHLAARSEVREVLLLLLPLLGKRRKARAREAIKALDVADRRTRLKPGPKPQQTD